MIVYNFKTDIPPSDFLRAFLDSGHIEKIVPGNDQMESFEITESGREYVENEIKEAQQVLEKSSDVIKDLNPDSVELLVPFLKFSIADRNFRIFVLLDSRDSKLVLTLPNNQPEAVEHDEFLVRNFLESPSALIRRIESQVRLLKGG
ncbi:hypothetical protein ABWH96_10245 [Marivirga tractuosa]|uniref:hypothetical protein n=1 Tax=Marivirga tractuosa TaxID=1006 RepID=UPI0035D004E7